MWLKINLFQIKQSSSILSFLRIKPLFLFFIECFAKEKNVFEMFFINLIINLIDS